ncbi:MAG: hypothetical protein ABIT38_13040 [Gemmatimonadaceae bacterium]
MTTANSWRIVLGASAAMAVTAPIFAPKSCAGGLAAYFWIGMITVVSLAVVPFALRENSTGGQRIVRAISGVLVSACIWLGCLFLANFHIICRLF